MLLLGGFFIGLGSIHLDDFLHGWDERYHALVARNMLINPLKPTLFPEAPLSSSYHGPWWASYIWMHKGPLFSWQMGLCMLIFGNGIVAMRLASVLMFMLLVHPAYRCARLFFPKAAYVITLLIIMQPLLHLLISGRLGMDHNDIAFIAYIGVSFWAWCEYKFSQDKEWIYWVGVAAAAAILTKWVAGSLIFCIWGLHILLFEIRQREQWKALATSILTCAAMVLPWFIYCYLEYREVFVREWKYNSEHLFEPLEGHVNEWYFHLKTWYDYFLPIVVFSAIGLLLIHKEKNVVARKIGIVSSLAIVAVMLVYSFAATALPAYTIILLLPVAFLAAAGIERFLSVTEKKWLNPVFIILLTTFSTYNLWQGYKTYIPQDWIAEHQLHMKEFYSEVGDKLPENAVIFNTPEMEFIEAMYYTGRVSYQMVPTEEDIDEMVAKGYEPILILDQTFTREEFNEKDYLRPFQTFEWPY